MADQELTCICGSTELDEDDNGFIYCIHCGTQVDGIVETGNADEDFMALGGDPSAAIYSAAHTRQRRVEPFPSVPIKAEPISQSQSQSKFWEALTHDDDPKTPPARIKAENFDGVGPTSPKDFGWVGPNPDRTSVDDHNNVRVKYVMGLQLMVESQCEALMRDFGVSPLICGFVGTLWLRLLAASPVFDDGWDDDTVDESEKQQKGPSDRTQRKYCSEPQNGYGQRMLIIWLRLLKKEIPLTFTLATSFLACHVAREPVLATDIEKWSVQGKLPYLSAFVEIEKTIGGPSRACPMSSSFMFRPRESATAQKIESTAARIAETIGLSLPPVNFYAIASRFLRELRIPSEAVLPYALRVHEWSMPNDLWLSPNELRLPTRVCVMSILIVAVRIRYNIHGFGYWEKGLCGNQAPSSSRFEGAGEESEPTIDTDMEDEIGNPVRETPAQEPEFDASKLLCDLEARYNEISENCEYSQDLPTYLQFCKDVVFAGLEPSFERRDERKLIDELLDIYQSEKDSKTTLEEEFICSADKQEASRTDEFCTILTPDGENKMPWDKGYFDITQRDDESEDSSQDDDDEGGLEQNDPDEAAKILKDEAITKLKLDMDENRFHYIPPRVYPKRLDYLHYSRKRSDGVLNYVAHADYYILLRACAKVAEIEIRLMHIGVLGFERRLAWLEKRINQCLHMKVPSFSCEFCTDIDPPDSVD